MALVSPHGLAAAGESALHLVGDEQSAGLVNCIYGATQQRGRMCVDAIRGEQRVDDQCGDALTVPVKINDGLADVVLEEAGELRCAYAVGIGRRYAAHPGPQGRVVSQ